MDLLPSLSLPSVPLRFKISPCAKQTVLKRRGTEQQRKLRESRHLLAKVATSRRFESGYQPIVTPTLPRGA